MSEQSRERVPLMLITANVGSIFEDPDVLMKIWLAEFLKVVKEMKPKFLALHCQEIGGKNYEESMKHVDGFIETLSKSEEFKSFSHSRIFVDENFSSSENFTALASMYFIDESLGDMCLWDFKEKLYVPVVGKKVFSSDIERVALKEKAKFPQEFYPECKWSRKGFLRTRWKLKNAAFDLVNIHLFHDASNLVSIKTFPSPYTKTRQHALRHTLDRFMGDELEKLPFFIFGDFNFRPDTGAVIKKLTNNANPSHITGNRKDDERWVYECANPSCKLTVGKKLFDVENPDLFGERSNLKWLRDYDKELEAFKTELHELSIEFAPTYPFNEGSTSSSYMKTRCPAWCDRVLMNSKAFQVTQNDCCHKEPRDLTAAVYDAIGKDSPMGDHKPVFLKCFIHVD